MPAGRPTDYTEELAQRICIELAEGRSLREICAQDDMPARPTVFRWLFQNLEFRDQYTRSREFQGEVHAEEMNDKAAEALELVKLCDDPRAASAYVQAIKLQVEQYRWNAARLLPKKYGDRIQQEVTGDVTLSDMISKARTRSE